MTNSPIENKRRKKLRTNSIFYGMSYYGVTHVQNVLARFWSFSTIFSYYTEHVAKKKKYSRGECDQKTKKNKNKKESDLYVKISEKYMG